MAILEILTYPEPRLRAQAEPVDRFDRPELQQRVDDLLQTMAALPACVGVAAPQVGYPYRLLVIQCQNSRKPPLEHPGLLVVGNPEILSWSGTEVGREGCLSLPDYTGNVLRAQTIQVAFQDRDGQPRQLTLQGFAARVMQHEIDHLNGTLFTDRIVSRKTDLFPRKQRQ
ncbi:MAG: peptide deformylase [Magnetococcales bacterium]|nr:peptide deformylase [Magnetococcales bacterium]